MRLTPRGPETKAVVDILERDDFDSPTAMAKELIKTVANLLGDRDWYTWIYRENEDALYLPYGIFPSDNEAKKFAGRYVDSLKGQHMILQLHSASGLDAEMAKHKQPSKSCVGCGHQLISHEHPKIQPKCAVRRCACRRATTE